MHLQRQEPSGTPSSDFDCEIFQRVLANAFAVQERRDFAALHPAQLELNQNLVPQPPLPELLEEITDPEEDFVPEFMMFPQNRHSLYARWGAVIVGVKELPGFRHVAVLAAILARRGRTVASYVLMWGGRSCPPRLSANSKAADKSVRPTLVSDFVQRTQNLNWSHLRRSSVPAAMIAIVLNFTFLMAHKRSHPATTVGPSALPAANASTVERRSSTSIPKPLPGKPDSAEIASALPKSIECPTKTASKTLSRKRAGENEVEYIGDDVTVRTFTRRSTQPSREPNGRTDHIGDDVTVRYFASSPPARTATR
jgi:hypothetical protein